MSIKLHTSTEGSPEHPAIVILHGLFGSLSNWRSIATSLSARYRVISVDLRNHGQSDWSPSMTYLDMAGDLAQLISDQQLKSPHLVGHSMGGKTVMAYLQHYPQPNGKAAVIDIAPVAYDHNHDNLVNALNSLSIYSLGSRRQADQLLSAYVNEPSLRQFLLQNLVRKPDGFNWRINLQAIADNTANIFGYPPGGSVDTDTLFIRGEKSDYINPRYEDEIHRIFPNSRISTVKNTGHWLHAEQPAALLNLLYSHFG